MIAWVRRLVRGCDTKEQRPSEAALERAREAREAAEARQPVVDAVAAVVRRAREENHLAERIEALFRGAAR
jgi:shikimate kinase